jgi:hypothetical protein
MNHLDSKTSRLLALLESSINFMSSKSCFAGTIVTAGTSLMVACRSYVAIVVLGVDLDNLVGAHTYISGRTYLHLVGAHTYTEWAHIPTLSGRTYLHLVGAHTYT